MRASPFMSQMSSMHRARAIWAIEAVPVVPSWWMTIEAAAMASSMASRWLAPAARAAARLAVTASPAPTMSISPRTGWAGTCSGSAAGVGAHDSPLGQRDEDGLAGAGGEIARHAA